MTVNSQHVENFNYVTSHFPLHKWLDLALQLYIKLLLIWKNYKNNLKNLDACSQNLSGAITVKLLIILIAETVVKCQTVCQADLFTRNLTLTLCQSVSCVWNGFIKLLLRHWYFEENKSLLNRLTCEFTLLLCRFQFSVQN